MAGQSPANLATPVYCRFMRGTPSGSLSSRGCAALLSLQLYLGSSPCLVGSEARGGVMAGQSPANLATPV